MSDQIHMTNLLDNSTINDLLTQYTDSQYSYINDINQGGYPAGSYIQLNLEPLKNQWVCYHDAQLMIPIVITGVSAAFTGPLAGTKYGIAGGADVLCFKGNTTAMIGKVQVTSDSGQTTLSDDQKHFINAVRAPFEHTKDWYTSESQELMYGLDNAGVLNLEGGAPTNTTNLKNGLNTIPVATTNANPPVAYSIGGGNGNDELMKRFLDFTAQLTWNAGATTYTGNIFIKLAYS